MKAIRSRHLWLPSLVAVLLAVPPAVRADEPEEEATSNPAAAASPAATASPAPSPVPEASHTRSPIAAVPLASKGRQLAQLNATLRSGNKRIATINAQLAKGQWYKDFRQTVQALLDDLMVAHTVYHYKPAGEKARNIVILFKMELMADDKVRYLSSLGPIEFRVDPKPKNIESWNYSYLPVGLSNTKNSTLTKNFMQYVKFYVVTTQGFQDRALLAEDISQHEELLNWIKPRGGITKYTLDEDLLAKSSKLVQVIFPRRMGRDEIAKVIAVLDYPKARIETQIPFWENIPDSEWPKFI